MARLKFYTTVILLELIFNVGCATGGSRVDHQLSTYQENVEKINSEFNTIQKNPYDKDWVKNKIETMFRIDQYMRSSWEIPFSQSFSAEEKIDFNNRFSLEASKVDLKNTADLKELLLVYPWFKISEFGKRTDNQAWLIVQHADQDREFQESILKILEQLWPTGETSPSNYAYLYDRVASSFGDPSKKRPQRYGTQGHCIGPGQWEPWPMESPDKVDELRKTVGLGTMEEYKKMFKDICH